MWILVRNGDFKTHQSGIKTPNQKRPKQTTFPNKEKTDKFEKKSFIQKMMFYFKHTNKLQGQDFHNTGRGFKKLLV